MNIVNKKAQRGFSAILVIVIILLVAGGGYFIFKNGFPKTSVTISPTPTSTPSSSLKTYTDAKYGYKISYPATLEIRTFDQTSGAAFRPAGTASDPQNEVIDISVSYKVGDKATSPLSEYAKTAATNEIQSYGNLVTFKEVKTESGVVGYETTWMVGSPPMAMGGTGSGPSEGLPITYFDLPSASYPSTVQVSLSNSKYLSEYEQMLKTFSPK